MKRINNWLVALAAFVCPAGLHAGVVAAPSALVATEGAGTTNYTVTLSSAPLAEVAVYLKSDPELLLNGCRAGAFAVLHFFPSNWNSPQMVTVAAYNDLTIEGKESIRIQHVIHSEDPAYSKATGPEVAVTIQDDDAPPPASSLPAVTQLPDPFRMNNGQRVATARDWRQRREEIKGLLQYYEYGFSAPEPMSRTIVLKSSEPWFSGVALRYLMTLRGSVTNFSMAVNVYSPGGSGPYPVVLNVGDDSSKAAVCLPRGYMLVTFDEKALDPDTEGYDVPGPAQVAYPDYDWGSLAVWAWGASRVMDYLVHRSDVDARHVIIRGHSRAGKAALLAGALDERFAMTAPNGAGTGGPSVYRIQNSGSETLASIAGTNRFASWFQPNFRAFAAKETRLPFDQHFLTALVAPRLLLTTDAVEDLWANPKGNQASREASRRVYDFLGAGANIGMHFRSGGHENLEEDWSAMLDYADLHFLAKPSSRNFDCLPYPSYTPGSL